MKCLRAIFLLLLWLSCARSTVWAYDTAPVADMAYGSGEFDYYGTYYLPAPQGHYVVQASYYDLTILNMFTGERLASQIFGSLPGPYDEPDSATYSSDGKFIATTSSSRGRLFDANSLVQYGMFFTSQTLVDSIFIPNTRLLAFLSYQNGRIFVFNIDDGQMKATYPAWNVPLDGGHRSQERLWESADGTRIMVAWEEYDAKYTHRRKGVSETPVLGGATTDYYFPIDDPHDYDFFGDGQRVILTAGGNIGIYNLQSGELIKWLKHDDNGHAIDVTLSPLDHLLAWSDESASDPLEIWIQRIADGQIQRLCGDAGTANAYSGAYIHWTQDEKYILAGDLLWATTNDPFPVQPWPADGLTFQQTSAYYGGDLTFAWAPRHVAVKVKVEIRREGRMVRDLGIVPVSSGVSRVKVDGLPPGEYEFRLTNTANAAQYIEESFWIGESDGEYIQGRELPAGLYKPGGRINFPWETWQVDRKTVKVALYRGSTLVKTLASGVPMEQGNYNWKIDVGPGTYQVRLSAEQDGTIFDYSPQFTVVVVKNEARGWAIYE